MSFELPQAALAELAAKYEALLQLRLGRDETAGACAVPIATKTLMRKLSQAFPGCLRELDRCSQALLAQRLNDLKLAQEGAAVSQWIPWIWRYHELLRVAFKIKRSGLAQPSNERSTFLAQCVSPPNGRMVPIVLAQLALEMNMPVEVINETLFPPRR